MQLGAGQRPDGLDGPVFGKPEWAGAGERIDDGRIVEHWGVPDRLGALFQLGLAQPPTRTSAGTSDQPGSSQPLTTARAT